MNAVIHTTNIYGEFIQKDLNSGVCMSGITTAVKDEGKCNSGFLGFGRIAA